MSITTDRKASLTLSENEVIDRLFHFFQKPIRKTIVTRRLNNGGISFTFTNATDEVVRTLEENFTDKEKKPPTKGKGKTMDKATLLKMNIFDLNLTVRTLNCLKAADIKTVADLCKYNPKELLPFRNFGHKSLEELEQLLKRNGLSWAEEPETP